MPSLPMVAGRGARCCVCPAPIFKLALAKCRRTPWQGLARAGRLISVPRGSFTRALGALNVSEYTDEVDNLGWNKSAKQERGLDDMLRILTGLLTCNNFKEGSRRGALSHPDNQDFFQSVFEIGRRYKIMNPEKMRSTYGKMMYILQDAEDGRLRRYLGFSCLKPIVTVSSFLEERNAEGLLDDERLPVATQDIGDLPAGVAQKRIQAKAAAVEALCARHASARVSAEEIQRVLFSIADHHSYISVACKPVRRVIYHLKKNFSAEKGCSDLTLRMGANGSKLSHGHATQFNFVLQSLTLWEMVCEKMFYLWSVHTALVLARACKRALWAPALDRRRSARGGCCCPVAAAPCPPWAPVHGLCANWSPVCCLDPHYGTVVTPGMPRTQIYYRTHNTIYQTLAKGACGWRFCRCTPPLLSACSRPVSAALAECSYSSAATVYAGCGCNFQPTLSRWNLGIGAAQVEPRAVVPSSFPCHELDPPQSPVAMWRLGRAQRRPPRSVAFSLPPPISVACAAAVAVPPGALARRCADTTRCGCAEPFVRRRPGCPQRADVHRQVHADTSNSGSHRRHDRCARSARREPEHG